jgi:type II secretion system protein N
LKRTVIFAALGLVAFGVVSALTVLFFARVPIVGYFIESGVKELKREGYRVRYDSLTASGLAFSVRNIEGWKGLFSLAADEVTVRPTLGALSSRALAASIEAKMYGGVVKFSPRVSNDRTFQLEGTIRDIQLSQHPQILGLGITNGKLEFNLDSLTTRPDRTLSLRSRLSVTNLAMNPPPLPLPIRVPAIRDGSLECDIESSERETLISNAELASSLVNASGEIRMGHDYFRQPSSLKVQAKVIVTDEGQAFIGPYLPLISKGGLNAEASQFRLVIDVTRCTQGSSAVFRMGGTPFCGTVTVQ